MAENWQIAGFGLYLHWPFCQAKCPYCDFNSHVAAEISVARWRDAYLSEIDRVAEETSGRVLSSIFFGGGTPSLMPPDLVADILERIHARWPVANDPEITLEANPTSVEAARFRGFREAGVNRVSVGIQALNDDDLKRLGRLHSVAEAEAAFDIAAQTFDRASFDLIYARQDQSPEAWRGELGQALAMAKDHVSLYQLTIEPGTAFGERHARGGLRGLPDEDLSADLYLVTQEMCEAAGLPAYETSNHARADRASRHNLIYWRQGDYVGVGPGAHGRLTLGGVRYATETALAPAAWLEQVETGGSGEAGRVEVAPREWADDYAMMSLRLSEGMEIARHQSLGGRALAGGPVAQLIEDGFLERAEGRLRASPAGRPVLNGILRELIG